MTRPERRHLRLVHSTMLRHGHSLRPASFMLAGPRQRADTLRAQWRSAKPQTRTNLRQLALQLFTPSGEDVIVGAVRRRTMRQAEVFQKPTFFLPEHAAALLAL